MSRCANQTGRTIVVALGFVALLSIQASAGTIDPTTDIIFQPLMTDIAIASLAFDPGPDPLGVLTYEGPFDQTGWNGLLGGNYLGMNVTGTMAATISGDPDWTVTGKIKLGSSPERDMSLSLNQDPTDKTKFNLGANSTVGTNTWSGTVTEKITGNQDVLTGTLTRTTAGNVQTMYMVSITLDLKNDKIISTFTPVGVKGAKPFGDMGTYSLELAAGGNFNGNLNVEVATVPEPGSIVLAATALLGGLGCWCRRRRKRSHYEAA
jgi:hypothetical protein